MVAMVIDWRRLLRCSDCPRTRDRPPWAWHICDLNRFTGRGRRLHAMLGRWRSSAFKTALACTELAWEASARCAGNRTAKQDYLAGVTSNYTYDRIYELTQVMQGTNTTESYRTGGPGSRF